MNTLTSILGDGSAALRELYGSPTWPTSSGSLQSIQCGSSELDWKELSAWGPAFLIGLWVLLSPNLHLQNLPFCCCHHVQQMKFLDPEVYTWRSFDNFLAAAEKPPVPKVPFQAATSTGRAYLYRRFFRGSLWSGNRFILSVGVFGMLLAWWIRNSEKIYCEKAKYDFVEPSTVRINMAAVATVHQALLPLCSFLLSFWVVLHVWWLYRITDQACQLQGRIYDVAMLMGAFMMPHRSDERVHDALWTIYRHLNLIHLLAYEQVSETVWLQSKDLHLIAEGGLLNDRELIELEQVDNRIVIVFTWLGDMLDRLIEAQLVPVVFSCSTMESLHGLQDAATTFVNQARRAPLERANLVMQYAADIISFLTPATLVHLFSKDDARFATYFWPTFGSLVVATGFQGSTSLVKALQKPFEKHMDCLNPDHALATTERQIFGCLAGEQGMMSLPEMPILLQPRSSVPAQPKQRPQAGARPTYDVDYNLGIPVSGSPNPSNLIGTEQVPEEYTPEETQWVPHESAHHSSRTYDIDTGEFVALTDIRPEKAAEREHDHIEARPAQKTRRDDTYVKGARWGCLDQGMLQATIAGLKVPRDITLDQASLERLETVTARPLAELAAAIFRAERTQRDAENRGQNGQLALEDQGRAAREVDRYASGEIEDPSGQAAAVYGQYQRELQGITDLRTQIATLRAQGALAANSFAGRPPPPRALQRIGEAAPAHSKTEEVPSSASQPRSKDSKETKPGTAPSGSEVLELLKMDVSKPVATPRAQAVKDMLKKEQERESHDLHRDIAPGSIENDFLVDDLVDKEYTLQLCIKEKCFSTTGDDFMIKKDDGSDYLKIKAALLTTRHRMVLCDLYNQPIAVCIQKTMSMERCFYIYSFRPRVEGQQTSGESENGYPLYTWAKVNANLFAIPRSFTLYMATGHDVFDDGWCKGESPAIFSPKLNVTMGGRIICAVDRGLFHFPTDKNVYAVSVMAGVDPALMLCFVAIKDELNET